MSNNDAATALDAIASIEGIPAARMVQILREWKAAGIDAEAAVDALEGLRPAEVVEVIAFARRKQHRRRRPR